MKKFTLIFILFLLITAFNNAGIVLAANIIQVSPAQIYQGDPILITISNDIGSTSTINIGNIKSAYVSNSKIKFFNYNNTLTALYGIDINHKIGTTTVTVNFTDGRIATTSFYISKLKKPEEFLAIPAQLGGNSVSNQIQVVSILNKENANLATYIGKATKALWLNSISSTSSIGSTFEFPVASTTASPLVITDSYGYSRNSGAQTVTHKGVDFHAPIGTPVYAINDGIVLTSKKYTVYGNTIIIDHGLGLVSMYMHLSKSIVKAGQTIKKGQLIGLSGETGYSEGPHLHLTIRIGGISIDPIKFFQLF